VNLGIVIPVYNLTPDRFSNLKFVLSSLVSSSIKNINVVEQETFNTNVATIIRLFCKVRYIRYKSTSTEFNKSVLLNNFFFNTDYEYVWMLDGDVFMDYNYVLENLPSKFDFVRPYDQLFKLSKKDSQATKNTSKIFLNSKECEVNNYFGKYSYIISRRKFMEVGGYNENFKGWGFQDLDLFKRINKKNSIISYTKNKAYHLYHPKAPTTHYQNNKRLFFVDS